MTVRAADLPFLDAPRPLAFAHRGGAAYGPNVGVENTLAAFRRAVDLGYRYVETDVHATSDGRVVAFHDADLGRVTGARGRIGDLPYAALRPVRVGGTEAIPLLEELLEELPEARVNIDVKSDAAVGPTVDVVRRAGAVDRVCVGSFSERRVRAVRAALGPRLATAAGPFGVAGLRLAPAALTRLLHTPAPVLQVPPTHRLAGREITLVTGPFVAAAHRLGKQVHVWFHRSSREDAAEMNRLLDLGVDGLITDHVDVLRDVLDARGTPLPGTRG
ncbi:MAG TPA: glycerophosphodiester phosphodiesterase family protein [Dermatophilaceae bacterium]|nr:glycerophosphodiester phosphodiesterase family protein [Dermatophilaceae bacterium]